MIGKNVTVKFNGTSIPKVYDVEPQPLEKVGQVEDENLNSTEKEYLSTGVKEYGTSKITIPYENSDLFPLDAEGNLEVVFNGITPEKKEGFYGRVIERGGFKLDKSVMKREITLQKLGALKQQE